MAHALLKFVPRAGSLLGRFWPPSSSEFCSGFMPTWLATAAMAPGSQSLAVHCGFTRAMCAAPQAPMRGDELFGTFVWHIRTGDLPSGGRVFTDGPLLDGTFGSQCLALGWAFVVIGDDDEVAAAAFGVPPRWVDTIQGAELWAVQMALTEVVFPQAIYTDCRTVQQGLQQSTQWLHSSKRRYARIWSVIHSNLDDGAGADTVTWMPAHTSACSVGEARCSNGELLTSAGRFANELADMLAKRAAGTVRQPEAYRRDLNQGQAPQGAGACGFRWAADGRGQQSRAGRRQRQARLAGGNGQGACTTCSVVATHSGQGWVH